MVNYKLANILIAPDELVAHYTGLYWHDKEGSARYDATDNELVLTGIVDFTTYFNGLSIEKWRHYASVDDIILELTLSGDACQIYATSLFADSEYPVFTKQPLMSCGKSDMPQKIRIPLPKSTAEIEGFVIISSGTTKLLGGAYHTMVDENRIRPIKLAIATTTFKKEKYITCNIEVIQEHVLGSDDPIAKNFHMFVIDNGRTLDAEKLSSPGISVIPNANVGGSGGFARGMMEALDWEATHVLLMDDDVRVLPESFKRTFALLSLTNDRYKDAFINGAMLSREEPNRQFEDVAVVRNGHYNGIKDNNLRVDTYKGIEENESVSVEVPHAYGAWWYSCIPVTAIHKHGLPLPFFVRCDDVEYGMRCKPTYMCMDGICVWHEPFEGRFRGTVDRYQYVRNFLIMNAMDDTGDNGQFMLWFERTFHIYLRAMNYDVCDLILDGLEDYLKGPKFLESVSGERLMKEKGKENEKLLPLNELSPEDQEMCRKAPASQNPWVRTSGKRSSLPARLFEIVPYDRHLIPNWLLDRQPVAVNYARGAYPASLTAGHSVLVAYNQDATQAHVRRMNKRRWQALNDRYHNLVKDFQIRNAAVVQSYLDAKAHLTSRVFWEHYLGLEGQDQTK